MKITIVAGARPNFMKIAPIVQAIQNACQEGKDIHYRLIYTGKEDDSALDQSLFSDLNIPAPDSYLGVEEGNPILLAAGIMVAFDKELQQHPSDVVLVVDDLTPTMSCTIVAKKRNIRVAHLVAGTRSFDLAMPKEVNRLITDGLSDYLFTASQTANRNLAHTGTENEHIYPVGNILIDTLRNNYNRFTRPAWFASMRLEEGGYVLCTLNRHVLLNNRPFVHGLLDTLRQCLPGMPVVAPLHTYARQAVEQAGNKADNFYILPTQSYLNFSYLTSHAKAIITDSGNVAEEATFLGIPCITLNNYAEHPETWKIGTNLLVGENLLALADALNRLCNNQWKQGTLPEQWDGRTAERIVQILTGK